MNEKQLDKLDMMKRNNGIIQALLEENEDLIEEMYNRID